MTRKTLNAAIAAALFGTLALAGCKKKAEEVTPPPVAAEPAPAPATPPPAPTPAPAAVTTVELGNATGADNRVTAPLTSFATKDTIHASVATDGGTAGNLNAKWTFQDGQVVHTEDKAIAAGPQVTDFQISKPDGWPTGKYKLEVSLDGKVVQTRDFDVK
jgi:hypothetical protein